MGATRDDFIKYPRTPHLFGSKGTDAGISIVYLEPPIATILKQNQQRSHPVPGK